MSLDTTYSDAREQERKQAQAEQQVREDSVKALYEEIADSAALADLLAMLDAEHKAAATASAKAVSNPHEQAAYGQRAFAYGVISSYIRDKLK